MTLDEFVTELEQLDRNHYPFEILDVFGSIRTRDGCHCPITAVCDIKTGARFSAMYAVAAGITIDLCERDIARISRASDLSSSGYDPALRSRILSALGLREAA